MPMPTLNDVATLLYEAVAPITVDDEANDFALAHFCQAIGLLIEEAHDWSREDGDFPGWSLIMDASRAPDNALAWLGQFAGVRIPAGLDTASKRVRITSTDGFNRGSAASLQAAPEPYLTDTKTVQFFERFDPSDPLVDSPYRLYVATLPAETPDPDAVEAALIAQKPAGIVLYYRAVDPNTDYESVLVYHDDYAELLIEFATYDDMFVAGHTYRDATTEVGTYAASTGTYDEPMAGM